MGSSVEILSGWYSAANLLKRDFIAFSPASGESPRSW